MNKNRLYLSLVYLYDFVAENKDEYSQDIGEIIYALSTESQHVLAEFVRDLLFEIAKTPSCAMYKLIKSNPDLTVDNFLRYTQDKRFNEVKGLSLAPFPKFVRAMSLRDRGVNLPQWFEELKGKINE